MCLGDKNNYNDPPPKPAQLPQYSPSSSKLPARASMPSMPPPYGSPPSGPPPALANPDTSLLPPPPDFFNGYDSSPANNATQEEAERGDEWCARFPLYTPQPLDAATLAALSAGNINMFAPPGSPHVTLARLDVGVWRGAAPHRHTPDTYLATYPPLYSPLHTRLPHTAYFEVRVIDAGGGGEVPLALGFSAPPYPGFRLPGWHRGSVAVHGDDGHKYVNNSAGGEAGRTGPFRSGETVGLGVRLSEGRGGVQVDAFITRQGEEVERWALDRLRDSEQDTSLEGLQGMHDLCAAVGVFGKTTFEVVFVPERWVWRGWRGEGKGKVG
ncbi:hypothetical protein F4810DRAFT_360865 [Camillea tinctor]|nr:hypothetical protein F4810DRAFT_360865 [Camillea tinctor]